jgi:hypothetical protein
MRFLLGLFGIVLGALSGLVSALFAATIMSGDNILMRGFIMIWAGPIALLIGAILGAVVAIRMHSSPPRLGSARSGGSRNLILLSSLVSIPLVILAMLWAIRHHDSPPSDQELLTNFERQEAALNLLIQMQSVDKGLIRVDADWTDPRNPRPIGVSAERIATYRQLLDQTRTRRGFRANEKEGEVDFYYWMIGSAVSSDTAKGCAYLVVAPLHALETLDRCRGKLNGVKAYRHIRGNWYLFFEYVPG